MASEFLVSLFNCNSHTDANKSFMEEVHIIHKEGVVTTEVGSPITNVDSDSLKHSRMCLTFLTQFVNTTFHVSKVRHAFLCFSEDKTWKEQIFL